jgi:WD40 repeat protein
MRALAWSPDGQIIAAAGRNGKVRLWDALTGRAGQEYKLHEQRVRDLAFSPDGTQLVTVSEDRTIRITELASGDEFFLATGNAKVMAVTFCGPDLLASGGSDNTVRIWNLKDRTEVARLTGHTGSVAALAYGGELLVSSGYDSTVRVWTRERSLAESASSTPPRVGALPLPRLE